MTSPSDGQAARHQRWPRAALPAPTPTPHRRFRFSRWLALLTVATVLLALMLAGVALAALAAPQHTTGEVTKTIVPAERRLERARVDMQRGQDAFVQAIFGPPTERSLRVSEAQDSSNLAAASWDLYKKQQTHNPAERRLITQYDQAIRESQGLGGTAFALADSPDLLARQDAFNQQNERINRAIEILLEIRSRFYITRMVHATETAHHELAAARRWIIGATAAIIAAVVTGGALLIRNARRDERTLEDQDAERVREERRANLENQLQRGLEMEPTEESTHSVIEAAIVMVRPHEPVELLVADSSRAHFQQAFSTDHDGGRPGCLVTSPLECPAASSGQTRTFLSSTRLDSCPFLRARAGDACSATCVPVNIAGNSIGVFHTTGPELVTPDVNELAELELVARKTGERIGYLRVLARSEMQAHVDPLTGLVNRRSLETQARTLMDRDDMFVVAFADLDHFKNLNDAYGHETGDRALRLFARVLREAVRPADVPARYGGEEFVVLLPATALPSARTIAERIRERLRAAVAETSLPAFTVSIGLAAWEPPEEFTDTVVRADGAMLHAKQGGRDRVVTSTQTVTASADPDDPRVDVSSSP